VQQNTEGCILKGDNSDFINFLRTLSIIAPFYKKLREYFMLTLFLNYYIK